jgi:site-specific DNA-methyltransferase (adenine-specific)
MNSKNMSWDIAPNQEYFDQLFRVSKNQIVWGANYFSMPPTRGIVIWDKDQPWENFSAFEYAWTSFSTTAKIFKERATAQTNKIHPTQKSVDLYKWCLSKFAKPGDKILDTHLGSGSSRIAAWDMGFDFYGYELDAGYFAAMEARFRAHISKPALFAPDEMYNFEQGKLF